MSSVFKYTLLISELGGCSVNNAKEHFRFTKNDKFYIARKMKFSVADLVTFTEEKLHETLHFSPSVRGQRRVKTTNFFYSRAV